MKHTPGPWEVRKERKSDPTLGWFHGVFQVMGNDPFRAGGICGLFSWGEECADADLIAAAPDLLAACKEALTRVPEESKVIGPMLRAAIDKAEGRIS